MIARRRFLQWGAALPLALGSRKGAGAASATAQNTLLVLDGFGPGVDPTRVAIVLEVFARKGLPVTCLIDPAVLPSDRAPGDALCPGLRRRLARHPGLLQVVPLVPSLGGMRSYFQARAAHEAQKALQDMLWGAQGAPQNARASQTLACDMQPAALAPSGLRACGVRTVLMRPHVSGPVRPEAWDDGVVRLVGGQRMTLQMARTPSLFYPRQGVERVFYLSAQDFSTYPLARLAPAAAAFAQEVLAQRGAHWVSPILASDLQFRDAYAYRRNVALHFVLSPQATPQDRAAVVSFRRELEAQGVPSSFGPEIGPEIGSEPGAGYWISLDKETGGAVQTFRQEEDEILPPEGQGAPDPGVAVFLSAQERAGLTARNILNLPSLRLRDEGSFFGDLLPALGTGDGVLAVSAELLQSGAYRSFLMQALQGLERDGMSSLVSLPEYVRRLVPRGPYLTHLRRTQAYRPYISQTPKAPDGPQRAQLLADAKVAWSYFERWTNPKTGLCPATVNFAPGQRRLHETVTMWDVGSHILALIAAVDLELISPKRFERAIRAILPNIAGRRSQGRLLPQGWIATDKFKWGNRDFDGCDAGRLLAALYRLERHPLAKGRAAPIVASWDLDDIVQDGVIYSVEDGELVSTFRSHCAHYAAWAFRTWGIEAKSPYEVWQGKSPADGQMALLEVSGHIGPLGAEPLLMEALEFGMSPHSAYLADVLFAAHVEEYDKAGRLIAVSEGPINSAPWFLYQGLQFDAAGRVWATDTVASLPEHRTKAFIEEHLSVSSKAAFLWAAYKDHAFSDALLAKVRAKARTRYGFASSINDKTGKASTTYSDINTNAVILQSIAHLLLNTD